MEKKAKVKILCVDDEPNILSGFVLNLRRHYEVETASSGAAGLQLLKSKPEIAIVLSDMRMPGMNGVTFLSQVRALVPRAVCILLTGESELQNAAASEGIFCCLAKPCTPPELLRALDAAVEQYRSSAEERRVPPT